MRIRRERAGRRPVTPPAEGTAARVPLIRAVAALAARLRRRRGPKRAGGDRNRELRIIVAGAIVTCVLVVLAVLFLDALSVGWAHGLWPGVAGFFRGMTRFGKSDWYLVPSGVFGLVLLAADWRRVPLLIRVAWAEVGALIGYFFFAVAIGGLLTDLVKWTVGRSRPVLFLSDGILAFHPITFGYPHASFPSGHATTVAAATVAIGLMSRRWAVPMAILAIIVAVSRVTVGAHYPSDVIGGLFIGAAYACALALWLTDKGVAFRRDDRGRLRPRIGALRRALVGPGGLSVMFAGAAVAIGAAFSQPRRRSP